MNTDKKKLREKLRSKRLSLPAIEAEQKSKIIIQKLLKEVNWPAISSVHIYMPVPRWNEVNTEGLIAALKSNWPKINISTPLPRLNQPIPTVQFDLIIVPVLGFDRIRNRLGNGGGWYDRFLAAQVKSKFIGLAYSLSEVKSLPAEKHDQKLDIIITEKEVIKN